MPQLEPAAAELDGVDELNARRARKKRGAPAPVHPKPEPTAAGVAALIPEREITREVSREVSPEVPVEVPADVAEPAAEPVAEPVGPAATAAPAVKRAEPARRQAAASQPAASNVGGGGLPLPQLDLDLTDPTMMIYSPTVLSVPAVVMLRFEAARPAAASHTALVLDALRAHAAELPDLVLAKRPGPRPGDLFPLRAVPGGGEPLRPQPLRIRPTVGELRIMDGLTDWVNDEIRRRRPGGRKVSRSEVVAVALDKYLPESSRKRRND